LTTPGGGAKDAQVDLIWLGDLPQPDGWCLGRVFPAGNSPYELERGFHLAVQSSRPDAWLFWDGYLGAPDPVAILGALERPGDLWHAGLRLGMAGLPEAIDFVAPTWMLNCDPSPEIEATSWRLSLRACLVREEVMHKLGFIHPGFETLGGAGLEWGHRVLGCGALARHIPWLVGPLFEQPPVVISYQDQLRFILYRYGRKWAVWAAVRAMLSRSTPISTVLAALGALRAAPLPAEPEALRPFQEALTTSVGERLSGVRTSPLVSALIPTLDRYPYLRVLLDQLRHQTIQLHEIIVIDQTPVERRSEQLPADFADLPVRWLYRDRAGQCSARNAGLQVASGEAILFLDDDDEVPDHLAETLVDCMQHYRADVVCGVAHEVGAGPLPHAFTYPRASDVFPANNTLAQKQVFRQSGLFDLAYERGARADGDLGMRVYLSGALILLDPAASVLHHHAPAGGLRVHKARVVTYASSRARLTQRHIASSTEIYLACRYFTSRQLREMVWLNVLGTFSARGGRGRQVAKVVVSLLLLPSTLLTLRKHRRMAAQMLKTYPTIPELGSSNSPAS
jgi:glycosyltransferase involved in cell wall biosynthesis